MISSPSGIDRLILNPVLEIDIHGFSEANDVDRTLEIFREGSLDVHEIEKIGIGHLNVSGDMQY